MYLLGLNSLHLPTPHLVHPGSPSAPLLYQSQVTCQFSSGLGFIMGVPAGAPGLLMLPGRAGGVELIPSPYTKSSWSVPSSNQNCLWIPRSIPQRAPHPSWTAEPSSVKAIEIGKWNLRLCQRTPLLFSSEVRRRISIMCLDTLVSEIPVSFC